VAGGWLMPVYPQKFREYKGTRTGSLSRWCNFVRADLDRTYKRRSVFWIQLFVAFVFLSILTEMWLLTSDNEIIKGIMDNIARMPRFAHHNDLGALTYMRFFNWSHFYVFVLAAVVGGGLISRDRASGALTLYFSRPLGRWSYIAARFTQLAVCLSLVCLVPGLLLYFLYSVISADWVHLWRDWQILRGIVLHCLILITTSCLIVMALSSLCKRTWAAGAAFIMFYMIGSMISSFFSRLPWRGGGKYWHKFQDLCHLTSLGDNWMEMSDVVFMQEPYLRTHWGWSLLILVGLCLLSLLILYVRLRPVEVVK
jgi:ABC-type transport system involved in multi-copper enzyme maturation permease subunit